MSAGVRTPGRHAPARGRDDEAVEAEAGDVGQLRERAERQRPGGVLAPQAPADQQAGDPGGRGARAQPGKRRRDDRAACRAFAQRERVRRIGIGDQIERGRRQLAVAVVFAVLAPARERERPARRLRARREIGQGRCRREGDVGGDLQRARAPFGRFETGHRLRRLARPARGRSAPARRRRARAGPAASRCRAAGGDVAAPAPGTARRCRAGAGRRRRAARARARQRPASPPSGAGGSPPRSRRAAGSSTVASGGRRIVSSSPPWSSTP